MNRLAAFAFVFAIMSAGAAYSQQYEITTKPDNHVVPVHCVCSRDSLSGGATLEFFSEGVRAAVHSIERGDTLTIQLIPHRRDQESQITFAPGDQPPISCPTKTGIVQVVLCHDTAIVETSGGRLNLLRRSDQLIVDFARIIPTDVMVVQTTSRQSRSSHTLIAAAKQEFPGALELRILEPGIYPSLEFPVVRVANIGRRQKVNETARGYLIAFHILNEEKSGEVEAWLDLQRQDL